MNELPVITRKICYCQSHNFRGNTHKMAFTITVSCSVSGNP